MASAFDLLHPGVQRKLWDMKWEELRLIQTKAIQHILGGGGDCVIQSPTAGGKTEAAFLPVLSAIAEAPLDGVRAMYVGPLKALINDQFGRLEDLCSRMELPVHKWHGDVGEAERRALMARPGGVILITPESLEAMFVLRAERISQIFGRLSYVVIDELHAFLGSPRGAQLRSLLHRLGVRAGCDPLRVGLSATLGNPDEALRWIRPSGPPATLIRDEGVGALKLNVKGIWRQPADPDDDAAGPSTSDAGEQDPAVAELARAILMACRGSTNLIFANAKGQIEELADELSTQARNMGVRDDIVVHHGSLAKDQREHTEASLREDRPCSAVCSNTLEMGIDIGKIDAVVQVAAPWTVSSLVQRIGRSGRKRGQARVLRGFFVVDGPKPDDDVWQRLHLELLQGIAIIELMLEKFIEPAEVARAHWSTLVQQLLSTLAETGGMKAAELKARLLGSQAFGPLSGTDFAGLLRHLAREDLVEQIADGSLVLGLKGQRIVEHFTFFAAFRTPIEFRVIHGNAEIGKLPELTAPTPGDHVILAGKRWLVERVDPDRREIGVIPSKGKKRPKFTSLGGDVHPAVHAKMQALLSGDVRPSYLDDTAFEMLVAARGAAAAYHDCRPALVSSGGRVKLFVWQGSRITRTILLVLAGAGLKVRDEEVGLDVEGSLEAVRSALMSFLSNPDGERLASVAEESLHARLLGGDKFDRYLPPELWRRAFVAERLDVPGALAFIREVMAPDPTPPSGGPGGLDDASSSGSLSSVASSAAPVSFRPLVSLWSPACGGFDTSARRGTLGEPCWAPAEFLSDLELRLGLPPVHVAPTVRAQIWAVRMEDLGTDHFFSRSLSIDRLGTARALLELRDQLLDAGWNGEIVDHAGERIDVIRRLEATQSPMLPFGLSDRLRRVEGALERTRTAPYQAVRLCEDESLWSGRWRRVFDLLRDRGTRVAVEPPPAWAIDGSEQDENTDLGTLKHVLSSAVAHGVAAGPSTPAGDGSVVILRTETSGEAAESVAALARSWAPADLILIRGGDHAVLDAALSGQRLPTLGTAEASAWRPLLGVLPLTLELIFEPRDPLRLIEILTLPGGPFRGHVGWSLARAVAAEPGVGGRRWTKEIVRLRSLCEPPTSDVASDEEEAPRCVEIGRIQRQLSRVADWLEGPLYDPVVGAPRAAVLETLGRIRSWALGRLQTSGIIQRDRSAVIGQLEALALALAADPRQVFPRDAVRQLVGDVRGAGDRQPLWPEEAGRLEHVHHPSALRRRCNVVVWWNFVEAAEDRGAASPWRQSERTALTSAGIRFVDPARIQEARARSWRRAVLAANRRLLLVLPARAAGDPTAPHPFLDEVVAALGLDESGLTKLTITPDQLLAGTLPGGLPAPPADRVEPLALPTAKRSWQADPGVLQAPPLGLTVEALEALLGCPLKWALQYRARLRRSAVGDVPPVHRLAGILGHRLVEELHRSATAANQSFDVTTAPAVLDRLIATEGAVLLRPGMSFEREQLRRDLLRAVDQLASFLAESGFRISAVEDAFTAPWDGRELSGRLDLLLARPGGELVLDLKWGHSSYRDAIEHGQALQLGAYAYMRAQATSGTWPATAYYSLSRGVVLTADEDLAPSIPVIAGKKAPEVWEAASCSLKAVRNILDTGRLPVTGLARSLPLLADAGVQDATGHLVLAPEKACEFCACQPICGKSWEEFENADA